MNRKAFKAGYTHSTPKGGQAKSTGFTAGYKRTAPRFTKEASSYTEGTRKLVTLSGYNPVIEMMKHLTDPKHDEALKKSFTNLKNK